MEKLMLYPFNADLMPLVRYVHLTRYEITAAISPASWGYCGKDISFCDGGPEVGIAVLEDIEQGISSCDTVFMQYCSNMISRDVYLKSIRRCREAGKRVIISQGLNQYLEGLLPQKMQIEVIGCNPARVAKEERLIPINIPTILVAGIGENCDKFSVQLAVREFFQVECDSILQFGTKDYCELFGFRPLPDFLFRPGDISKKIVSLNHYIYQESRRLKPDLLILGIPGGFSYMTMEKPKKFGELAFCISNAVMADACILSVYCNEYQEYQLNKIKSTASGKLGCEINSVHMANRKIILDTDAGEEQVSFLTLRQKNVVPVDGTFNVFDKDRTHSALRQIYALLTDTADVV